MSDTEVVFDDERTGRTALTHTPRQPRPVPWKRIALSAIAALGVLGAIAGAASWKPTLIRLVSPCAELHTRCRYSSLSGAYLGEALSCGMIGMVMTGKEWTRDRCEKALELLDGKAPQSTW